MRETTSLAVAIVICGYQLSATAYTIPLGARFVGYASWADPLCYKTNEDFLPDIKGDEYLIMCRNGFASEYKCPNGFSFDYEKYQCIWIVDQKNAGVGFQWTENEFMQADTDDDSEGENGNAEESEPQSRAIDEGINNNGFINTLDGIWDDEQINNVGFKIGDDFFNQLQKTTDAHKIILQIDESGNILYKPKSSKSDAPGTFDISEDDLFNQVMASSEENQENNAMNSRIINQPYDASDSSNQTEDQPPRVTKDDAESSDFQENSNQDSMEDNGFSNDLSVNNPKTGMDQAVINNDEKHDSSVISGYVFEKKMPSSISSPKEENSEDLSTKVDIVIVATTKEDVPSRFGKWIVGVSSFISTFMTSGLFTYA